MLDKYKGFLWIMAFVFAFVSLWVTSVTSSGLVTVAPSDISALWTGLTNMATSFITVGFQLLPIIIPLLAVFLIFGFVKSFLKRKG